MSARTGERLVERKQVALETRICVNGEGGAFLAHLLHGVIRCLEEISATLMRIDCVLGRRSIHTFHKEAHTGLCPHDLRGGGALR